MNEDIAFLVALLALWYVFCEFSPFLSNFSPYFQEKSQTVKDERKDHDTVDESSLEQQIRELADYTLIVRKNWSARPSATRSYGRQADEIILLLEIFKIL